ncbi:PREDICTED: U7 snRNA-associated Sm-like protein LSm10 [Ceratosolen solmsi marchali]|uniref:U7 snRNA-associated Sm-like protein LSm10 n=1 Tax=Ceratosolen solmsi marchali TaxID=326594 RepID=A0AAJ6YS15_9HYME|nr:PREDICTED: U7 snRNA-associated Sm-like protein LSm10 [Ceratosolen solmsi marchali]
MTNYATDKQERYFFYNSLAILLKAVEGERTIVDLRNEASIYGIIEQADGFMNIIMKDSIFIDPRGDKFSYEIFFIHARNIRYVHIPTHIRIVPSIKEQLKKLGRPRMTEFPRTFKSKRAEKNQALDMAAVNKILENKEENKSNPSGSNT